MTGGPREWVLLLDRLHGLPCGRQLVRSTDGAAVFEVNRVEDRLHQVVVIRDLEGRDVALLDERLSAAERSIVVHRPGATPATVRRVGGIGDSQRWVIASCGEDRLEVLGDIAHRCRFESGGCTVAETQDAVDGDSALRMVVRSGTDPILVVAATVAIEQLTYYA